MQVEGLRVQKRFQKLSTNHANGQIAKYEFILCFVVTPVNWLEMKLDSGVKSQGSTASELGTGTLNPKQTDE